MNLTYYSMKTTKSLSVSKYNRPCHDEVVKKIEGTTLSFTDMVFFSMKRCIKDGYFDSIIKKYNASLVE